MSVAGIGPSSGDFGVPPVEDVAFAPRADAGHIGAGSDRRAAEIVVRDRHGASDFLTTLLGRGGGRSEGVVEDLIDALGGKEAAERLGVRSASILGGKFKIPVEVDASFGRDDLAAIDAQTDIRIPLGREIAAALKQRNAGIRHSTSGIGIVVTPQGEAYLEVRKHNIDDADGLFGGRALPRTPSPARPPAPPRPPGRPIPPMAPRPPAPAPATPAPPGGWVKVETPPTAEESARRPAEFAARNPGWGAVVGVRDGTLLAHRTRDVHNMPPSVILDESAAIGRAADVVRRNMDLLGLRPGEFDRLGFSATGGPSTIAWYVDVTGRVTDARTGNPVDVKMVVMIADDGEASDLEDNSTRYAPQ